ncbi:MAG TPA: DUF4129 domain-containing protein [Symbiobacteriaceae bacterium]|nr:DUF4129 domain-containing protein [Symbiobacteriaceae bacterium]
MLPFSRSLSGLHSWALVALTDLAAAVPWIILFYRSVLAADWYTAIPGMWLALLVYGAASLWEAGDRGAKETSRWRRVGALGAGLLGTYLIAYLLLPAHMKTGLISGNPAWAFLPPAAYLWYQGTLAVSEGLDYHRLFARYPWQVVGAAAGIVLLMRLDAAAASGVRVLLYWSVILLLVGGMVALVEARERMLRAGQASIGEKGIGTGRQSRLIAVTVGVLLVLTLGASAILSAERMESVTSAVGGAVSAVLHWVAAVVYLIVYRYMLLIGPYLERFVQWALWMARRNRKGQPPPETAEGKPDELLLDPVDYLARSESLLPYIEAAVIIGAIVAVAVVLFRVGRNRRRILYADEEIINLGFWPNLLADVKALFSTGRTARGAGGAPPAEVLGARDPRMLFRRLQAWGAGHGRPRLESETPTNYAGALRQAHPDKAAAVGTITAAYNQAKYGAALPGPEQVDAAAAAADRLEAESR